MTPIRLRLYLTGRTVSAERARAALAELEKRLIVERGAGAVTCEIIDALETPEIAARDDVFATPTLVRLSPSPPVRLFGDLSSVARLLAGLGLEPGRTGASPSAVDENGPTVADSPAKGEDGGPWLMTTSDMYLSPAAALE